MMGRVIVNAFIASLPTNPKTIILICNRICISCTSKAVFTGNNPVYVLETVSTAKKIRLDVIIITANALAAGVAIPTANKSTKIIPYTHVQIASHP